MPSESPAERFGAALELFDLALEMIRKNTIRKNPNCTEEEIEQQIQTWLSKRPGAEYGDAEGTPISWPRKTNS